MKKVKKKEYFVFMFLPGPNSRPRVVNVSKSVLKVLFLSLTAIFSLSLYMVYEYNSMKDKIYEMNSIRPTIQEPVNFSPLLLFIGSLALIALIFFVITKLRRIIASSRLSAIKNKLVDDFCAALDNSPLKPSKGSNYAGK